jgi:flagellar biosynthetic protein FliR
VIDAAVMVAALTLARVGTFIYFLPLLGGPNVPRTVKVGLSMALTVLFYGDAMAALAQIGGVSGAGSATWLVYFLAIAREMLLGGILGFAFNLFLMPARIAGEFVAQESGLTFANVLTASGNGSANPLATLFEMLASATFFGLDLHHVFLRVLHETFRTYPVGTAFPLPNWDLVALVSTVHEGGLLLAAPMGLCLILTTVVLMLLSRAAPQLNLFSVGFPMRVVVSLAVLLLLMPQLVTGIVGQFGVLIEILRLRG